MLSLIAWLTANKELLGIGAVLSAAIAVYLKGYTSGSSSVRADVQKAVEEINQDLAKTEASNQQLDQKREEDANHVNDSTDVDELISLWNSVQKAPSSDAKKDK